MLEKVFIDNDNDNDKYTTFGSIFVTIGISLNKV